MSPWWYSAILLTVLHVYSNMCQTNQCGREYFTGGILVAQSIVGSVEQCDLLVVHVYSNTCQASQCDGECHTGIPCCWRLGKLHSARLTDAPCTNQNPWRGARGEVWRRWRYSPCLTFNTEYPEIYRNINLILQFLYMHGLYSHLCMWPTMLLTNRATK